MVSANALQAYIRSTPPEKIDSGFCAYLANLTEVNTVSPHVVRSIIQELSDQRSHLKLIASENYCSLATQSAMGNLLTDKYAEGFPHHRFYAGCDNVDAIEALACQTACSLFNCDHAYVQPHSGADANLIAFWAILSARIQAPILTQLGQTNVSNLSVEEWAKLRQQIGNQRLLGMDYYSGGHLTHGYRHNVSGQMFESYSYGVNLKTGLIDYDAIAEQAQKIKPLILLAGYSAYPRKINFKRMREIADSVNAVFMVDMAHFAGLVAGGVFTDEYNPVLHSHITTTTTHKTLRGPRGGMILCIKEFAEYVDKGCPLVIGGPLPHIIAAKTVALLEALTPEFNLYAHRIVQNAQTLAQACLNEGMTLASGGTDNHLMLIDVRSFNLTGRQAESALRECGITLNRNSLPQDPNGPWYTSGLRIGTPATTTLGMGESEMKEIAAIIKLVLKNTKPAEGTSAGKVSKTNYVVPSEVVSEAQSRVKKLLAKYPVYPMIDLEFLQRAFMQ